MAKEKDTSKAEVKRKVSRDTEGKRKLERERKERKRQRKRKRKRNRMFHLWTTVT